MRSPVTSPPAEEEFEITVLGTGGGYGESVVIHVGNGNWIIIDSCKSPYSELSLPVEYLRKLGVDTSTQVKLVLCTHFDDDHIQGMSNVIHECSAAKWFISRVTDQQKFLRLVGLEHEKAKKLGSSSSTAEFVKCLEILDSRGTIPIYNYASQDTTLFTTTFPDGSRSEVVALSPSQQSQIDFDSEISQLITEFGVPEKKLIVKNNHRSVVLLLKLESHRALLGADLEVTNSTVTGWKGIMNLCTTIDTKSSYFKIPHHGSSNGYDSSIWTTLLLDKPEATITPWNRNQKLPQDAMVNLYRSLTNNLFITSQAAFTSKPKPRDTEIEKAIRFFGYELREVKYIPGIIRSRIKKGANSWRTETFEAALKL